MARKAVGRPRRTKAEVQQEFESVRRETVAARDAAPPRADEGEQLREADVQQAASGVTVDGVVGQISALGLQISKALAEVSGQLVAEVERLATLREAVALEQRELERLHKLDVAATAVDLLVQDHEAKQQVQEIAVKAIEGASGARALAHVNQIAMEQARPRPSQG